MAKNWYAVKSLYRTVARGKPMRRDGYRANAAIIEERVVLFAARSFDEAIRKAEKEAREYAALTYRNVYGQRVIKKYLDVCDAFHLFEPPASGREVYSRTEVVTERPSASVTRLLGPLRERKGTRQFEPFA